MKILTLLEKSRDFWFLLFTSFFFFLLRLPSLFEPYWYGDEGIYQTIGIAMRQGRLLYSGIWDNKPPLLYILYSIFNSDQFALRTVSLIFGLLSVFAFFFLAKKLFKSNKVIYVTAFIFTFLFGIPLIEGNIANAENFMLLPIFTAGLLIFGSVEQDPKTKRHSLANFRLVTAGFLLSVAFLFKIVAVFDFAAFFLFLIFAGSLKTVSFNKLFKDLASLILGFAIPVLVTVLFFIASGSIKDFLSAAFLQNVGYVSYGNKFIIPQGFLILKLFLLLSLVILIFFKRKLLGKSSFFILLWLFFALFNAFFSQRPYPHYLLVLLPAFILFSGLVFSDKKMKKFYLILFAGIIILLIKNFSVYGKTPFYYQNFVSFVLGNKNIYSYRAFFDRQTPKDYAIAEFIINHTTKKDNIFIWGNNAQIYKMVNKLPPGRYTVAYHMASSKKSIDETQKAFYKGSPKYVIVTSNQNPIPFNLTNYILKINIGQASIYENIY